MSTLKKPESPNAENITMILSPIKRDKLKKKLRMEERERMRKSLPVLNRDEIRRYRVPYETALIMELEERGYPSSAGFLQQILSYHAALCAEHGPDSLVSSRPKLQGTHSHMDRLYNGLIKAEAAHYDGKITKEIDELLHLSIFFGLGSDDWWWLGEQLLIQSVNVSANYQGDGGERESISRLIFGKFLIEYLKDADRAIEHLDIARYLSLGKNWTAFRIWKQKQKSVFMETCGLLSDCYLKLAHSLFNQNIEAATKLCLKAITRGQEACEYKKVAEANLLKGRCDMDASRYKTAMISFQKSLDLYQRMKMIDEACEARIQLALALLACGNFTDSAYHLRKLLEYATDNDQPTYMGRAYRYLGEYYLNHGFPQIATPILLLSMRMFHRLNDIFNREQLKNLAAISQGQETLPYYIKLVSRANGPEASRSLQRLLAWKDLREPFWPKEFGSNANLKEQLLKDGLGTGLCDNEFDEDHRIDIMKNLVPKDEQFMVNKLKTPDPDIISIRGDGPIQLMREESLIEEPTANLMSLEGILNKAEPASVQTFFTEKVTPSDANVEKTNSKSIVEINESMVPKAKNRSRTDTHKSDTNVEKIDSNSERGRKANRVKSNETSSETKTSVKALFMNTADDKE